MSIFSACLLLYIYLKTICWWQITDNRDYISDSSQSNQSFKIQVKIYASNEIVNVKLKNNQAELGRTHGKSFKHRKLSKFSDIYLVLISACIYASTYNVPSEAKGRTKKQNWIFCFI